MPQPTTADRLRDAVRPAIDAASRRLARSRFAARCAAMLRNRADGIVARHLGLDVNHATNGEAWLLSIVAPRADTFVDVGANVGEWTDLFLAAAPPAVRGLVFEPGTAAFDRLRERFSARSGVTLLQMAASDREGTATFYEEPDAGRHSSLVAGYAREGARATTVRTVTLDAATAEHGLESIDYLKVDAEGHDSRVLAGAERLLGDGRIALVQFEYNDAWKLTGSRLGGAIDLLASHGYATFLLNGPALWRFPYRAYGEYYRYSNFVAVPGRRVEEIRPLIRGEA